MIYHNIFDLFKNKKLARTLVRASRQKGLALDPPAGRRTPLLIGIVPPAVVVEHRPPAAEAEARDTLDLVARADEFEVVVVKHRGEQQDVDVAPPEMVGTAAFRRNGLEGQGRFGVSPSAAVFDVHEHGRNLRHLDLVREVHGFQVVPARLAAKLDSAHKLVPVELVDRSGLGRDEEEESAWQALPEVVEHADRRELLVGESLPLEFEKLLGSWCFHRLQERGVLI